MSSISSNTPKRGEIWLVDFNPTRGAEIQKQRPAIVVSSDAIGRLPIKLVAPITGWKPAFAGNLWHVRVIPDRLNGLDKESAVDVLQVRGVDTQRFIRYIGRVAPALRKKSPRQARRWWNTSDRRAECIRPKMTRLLASARYCCTSDDRATSCSTRSDRRSF